VLSTVAVVPAIVSIYEDPDTCLSLLRKAIDAGSNPAAVEQSITFCPESKSFKWVPQTALHVAASLGLSQVVDFLLDIGVPHERKTTDSRSVLEAAVYANKLSVVRTLIDRISISK
jgi:ankyrin repeat protein